MTTHKKHATLPRVCLVIWFWIYCVGSLACLTALAQAADDAAVTNVSQIPPAASQIPTETHPIRLDGEILWAHSREGKFVLKDGSGVEELEMDLRGQSLTAGERVHVRGFGVIIPTGTGFQLEPVGAVVNNDGIHGVAEKSGAVFLKAGRAPLRLEWFNGVEKYSLKVEYSGPSLPRQTIPDSALFRAAPNSGNTADEPAHGLDFKCVEVPGELLPDFNATPALKTGVVSNFDLSVIPRQDHIGVRYSGFLQVPQDGLYTFYTTSDDGSRLFAGEPSLNLEILGKTSLPSAQPLQLGQKLSPGDGQWVQVEGKVTFASEESDVLKLELNSETGRLRAEVANKSSLSPSQLLNHRLQATGFVQNVHTSSGREVSGLLLVPSAQEIKLLESSSATIESDVITNKELPLLVNAAEVHRLKREEAQRGYPVKVRGVITSVLPEHKAFTLQDATHGIYIIDLSPSRSDPPGVGQYLEVEGVSDPGQFSPVIDASKVRVLGGGDLPEPIYPSWHQLMNGSLDAQYVEIQGILTSVQSNSVVMLTADGRIVIDFRPADVELKNLARYEDALIRVRGCLFANWDYVTRRVKVGEIRINGAEINVDQPAPDDLFSTPTKKASELPLFDPQAGVFQRVKVSGQILHIRDPEYFVMDGSNGVRFISKHPCDLQVGDIVDAVGFPELSMASPVLREAVMRRTGHAALPKPKVLGPDDLVRADLDSTLVQIKAVLVDQRTTATEQVLEMRVGLRSFLARLAGKDHSAQSIPPGSQLELTGTYASQGVNQNVTSFELLLNSPSDVEVLARPPWWTLEKLLASLGALACILAITVLWITQLHRKVAQRTTELELQIRERQRVEQQHVMEQERGRIAQDLHDELGSSLTEITMLGVRAQAASTPPEKRGAYLEQMSDKARQMVTALDEIVWAMNPTHNSIASMVSYFSIYAERFLGLANIALHLDAPIDPDDYAVDSRRRHQLFLAFKEALTNVVRHSHATEVRLNMQIQKGQLSVTVSDNGRGWSDGGQTGEMDGVTNMRARLQKLGGKFDISSKTGSGTAVRFDMPLK